MNQITVIGRLTSDGELRYTASGKQVSNFSVACNSGYGDNKKVQYFRCLIWGERAEKTAQYLKKGVAVTVFGEFLLNEYQKRDGTKGFSLDVNVSNFEFQGSKSDQPTAQPSKTYSQASGENPPIDDDLIPF